MEVKALFDTLDYGPAPESPDMANLWLQKRDNMLDHFIGGDDDYFATADLGIDLLNTLLNRLFRHLQTTPMKIGRILFSQ